jgi:hypothetical protein
MTDLIMIKGQHGLTPTDAEGWAALRQINDGALLRVKFSVPRNVRQHRLFFALINLVFEHQPEPRQFATREALREAITVAAGHFHEVRNVINGKVYTVPNSISFGALDQPAWQEFFEAAKRVIVEKIIPGINNRDLDQAIADMLQAPGPDQMER